VSAKITTRKSAKHSDVKPARQSSSNDGLTTRQETFVREYLIDLKATAAALAGYKQPNMQGPRLMVNDGIAAATKLALAERNQRTEISVDLVVQETWANYQRCVAAEEYGAANKAPSTSRMKSAPNASAGV
jgi:hypothetical protein